jgi:hypothetical protein
MSWEKIHERNDAVEKLQPGWFNKRNDIHFLLMSSDTESRMCIVPCRNSAEDKAPLFGLARAGNVT